MVSSKSGLLYERRLIEKHVAETGRDPVTGDELSLQDLVAIKSNKAVRPRPPQAASIPGMLTVFQNEWDALMLQNVALEQQLHTARQELAQSLYQADAAHRVIARVKKERDQARAYLEELDRHVALPQAAADAAPAPAGAAVPNGRQVEEKEDADAERAAKRAKAGITPDIIAELSECNKELSTQRKQRKIPESLAKAEAVEAYTQVASHPLHKTTKPGILALDIHPSKDLIVTGGMDGAAVVLDRLAGQVTSTLTGHSKRVSHVKFVAKEELLLTASADKTVRIWKGQSDGSYEMRHVIADHTAEVKAVTVHATEKYFVSASADRSWCFYELASGVCLTEVKDPSVEEGYTAAAFHPDGLILGTGTAESLVRIWDIKSKLNVAKFEGHTGPVTDISFSENGYFLATAGPDGVKLWDLRKLKNFRTFAPYDAGTPTNSVQFDHSGSYLALAGSDARIYQVGSVKQEWHHIKTLPDLSGTGKVTAVRFGHDAAYIALATMDRNLRIFAEKGDAEMVVD